MKCAIAIVLFYAMSFAIGQDIVDQFGYSSTFCSGTYYLYSDSSFVHERGCEERSSITLGSYVLKADTLYLHPKRFEEINFISKAKNITPVLVFVYLREKAGMESSMTQILES